MRKILARVVSIVTLVGVIASTTWPYRAIASEFQVASANSTTNAGYQKLGIGTTFGRWPGGTVSYVYNPTGAPAVFANNSYFVGLLQTAFAELEGVSGLTFNYQGIDSNAVIGNLSDGIVTVGWENLAGAAGQAGPASSCTAQDIIDIGYCQYVDGSVRLNNDAGDVTWDTGVADFTERQFHQVTVHELLHLVGIGHSEVAESIMFADPYTNLSHVRDDDIDALQSLYGEPEEMSQASIYVPPATGASPLEDSFISANNNIGSEITVVDGTEVGTFLGLLWRVPDGHTDDLTLVATDPHGFYYAGRVDDRNCNAGPGGSCLFWASFADMETVHTFPGIWTVYAIMNGNLIATESVTVTTSPVFNEAPDSALAYDVIYGPAPLTVKMTLAVTGDNEGDAVDATWHIPGVGEIPLNSGDFPGSAGEDSQTFTFETPGDYEVYVEVNDDWTRYGSGGNAAGPGFRTLYRRVVQVTSVADDITAFEDVTGDTVPDLAGFVGGHNTKPQVAVYSGANGNVVSTTPFVTNKWRGIALGSVRDANQDGTTNDPAIALLANHEIDDRIVVETRRADNGNSLGIIFFLNFRWRPVDIAVIDDTNGDGITDDTSIAVLAQRIADGRILVQIRSLGSGALVANLGFLNLKWSPVGFAVVDRTAQSPMGNISPLIGVLAENRSNGKRFLQSKLVSTGVLDQNIPFFNSKWTLRDVTVLHDTNGDGADTDPAWQVLAMRESDEVIQIETRLASNGATDSNATVLNANWDARRLDSALSIGGGQSDDIAVSLRNRSNATRLTHIKDYGTNATVINIYP